MSLNSWYKVTWGCTAWHCFWPFRLNGGSFSDSTNISWIASLTSPFVMERYCFISSEDRLGNMAITFWILHSYSLWIIEGSSSFNFCIKLVTEKKIWYLSSFVSFAETILSSVLRFLEVQDWYDADLQVLVQGGMSWQLGVIDWEVVRDTV